MGSVRIFQKSGIGLDYYKYIESMSRVVDQQKDILILQMECHQKMQQDILQIMKKHSLMSSLKGQERQV